MSDARIVISDERSAQLRCMIDKRVLAIMIATYFLQAIDKGTLSFSSIMGLNPDTGLVGQQVSSRLSFSSYSRQLPAPYSRFPQFSS